MQRLRALLIVAALGLAAACQRADPSREHGSPSASVAPPAPPVDRLAPDEIAPGTSHVFGFQVPAEMRVLSHSPDRAMIEGEVEAGALLEYVRERVLVAHVELGAGRTIFPNARIKDGAADRVYQLEVVPKRRRTLLLIEDVTPKPRLRENLTQEERWRRAGRGPDGKPLGIDQLK